MDNTSILVWSIAIQILSLAVGCTFIIADFKITRKKRPHEQQQHWYRRGLTMGGMLFILPVVGQGLPEDIISIAVFHGALLPSALDFNYQLFAHSLAFFFWLALLSDIAIAGLVVYVIYLGIIRHITAKERT